MEDNWLKEQIAEEKKLSVWGLYDDARLAAKEHSSDCDREKVETEHRIEHLSRKDVITTRTKEDTVRMLREAVNSQMSGQAKKQSAAAKSLTLFVVMFIIFTFLMILFPIISMFIRY